MKKIFKVDIRIERDLYDMLNYIVHKTGAKRSSWIRASIEERVSLYKEENDNWEAEYEKYLSEKDKS